ncbi:MAG TPA: hypothetical protein VFV66_26225 [Nonomuraea sp.]|nr:hypothetical protein [Nonomuraea sp.]
MDRDHILLTHPGTSKPKYLELRVEGSDLHRSWWSGTGKPQGRTKSFDHGHAARGAMEKVVSEKMRDGYALLRDLATAEPGELVAQCATPEKNGVVTFALHPDGHTVAVARRFPDHLRRPGWEVQTVDLLTGARKVVYTEAHQYTQIVNMAFEPDGSHLTFTVFTTRTGHVSYTTALATGHVQRLPHIRLGWDSTRQRMLVSDDDVVRVLGPDGTSCLDLPTGEPFRAGKATLSSSGRLVGLANHPDSDVEYGLEIWDVDAGRRVLATPFPLPAGFEGSRWFDMLMFDGSERILVASGTSGCFGVSVESGALCWAIEGERGEYESFNDVALSPDGTLLAGVLCRGPVIVYDVATGQPLTPRFEVPGQDGTAWYQTVGFSADGRFLAVGDYPGRVTVFRFDGVEFTKPGG